MHHSVRWKERIELDTGGVIKVVALGSNYFPRPLCAQRAFIFTNDAAARQQILSKDNFFSKGVKICFDAQKTSLFTFNSKLRNQREVCVSILGLPHYLRSTDNAMIIAVEVG